MRYPSGHKDEVRQRIVVAAARALRKHGLEGVSIPALMKEAGLTHGGFYSHFKNRDELVAEAVACAAGETAEGVLGPELTLEQTLARYLSPAHAAHPEHGCVVAALGTDAPRQSARIRTAFAEVASGFLKLIQSKVAAPSTRVELSDAALRQASTMVGAVVLSRLVRDPALSERVLKAARTPST